MPDYEPHTSAVGFHQWPSIDADSQTWRKSQIEAQEKNEKRLLHGSERMATLDAKIDAIAEDTGNTNETVTRLSRALLGDPQFESEGKLDLMNKRIGTLEKRTSKTEENLSSVNTKLAYWGGGLAVVTAIAPFVWKLIMGGDA